MDGTDRVRDDCKSKINFSTEGASRLREEVTEKLKEMGDYTDDSLVDYVLMLLRNGRSKDEATGLLDLFLGEHTVSFVSVIWEHLSSNLSLYSQSKELLSDDVAKSSRPLVEQCGRHNPSPEHVHENIKTDSEYEKEKLSKTSRSRRNMEWKGLVQEDSNPFPLRSAVTKILHSEARNNVRHNIRRSLSPKPQIIKKRSREDDRQPMKRDAASHPIISASRRLLQFAVRDAVRTVQQANSRPEPALKRLCSVVSTTTADSLLDERPQRLRSVARVPGALSTALRAAAEAAEDVTKDRCSGSVFDRLSHGAYITEPGKLYSVQPILKDGEYNHPDQIPESSHVEYYQRSEYDGNFTGDTTMLERDTAMPDDSASDNDEYNNFVGVGHPGLNASQSVVSANKDKETLTVQYSVAQDANEVVRDTRLIDQGLASSAIAKPSSKIVNISVNVNTWKPPNYKVARDASAVENQAVVDKNVVALGKANPRLPKDNDIAMTENEIARAVIQKETQKTPASTPGSYTTNRPSDVDFRTVFVSNVHFAATKDTLSRHFNKFGEVLKVIIVNDAATGQPKGSAYVEFLRKESAESALSLNGTYFMSRILKVVRKSCMQQEATTAMVWPRVSRASPFASRLNRAAFSRGVLPSAFRARVPIKPGARSLQWKRGGPAQATTEGKKSIPTGNSVPSPTGRNLTYVRPELKVDANSGRA